MTLRVVSLNLAHGRGVAAHQALVSRSRLEQNLTAVASFLDEVDADVACLQEVDIDCAWSGRLNHLEFLAERTTHLRHVTWSDYVQIRRGPVGPFRYGSAILSRFPIQQKHAARFPRRLTGRKGFCAGTVEIGERLVDVVSLHLDFARARTRTDQVATLVELLGDEHGAPLILAGDFNACTIAERDLFRALEPMGLRGHPFLFEKAATFPSRRPRRAIDHVWASAEFRFVDYGAPDVRLSDHRPVVASLEWRRV